MRVLKLLLLSFTVFFLLLTGVGLLFPARVQISRAIDLPGYQRSYFINMMDKPAFMACWADSAGFARESIRKTDSSLVWQYRDGTVVSWIFHGIDGSITLQGHVESRFSWLPWQRFRSLLMEPRYGPWLEKRLGRFKVCTEENQVASMLP